MAFLWQKNGILIILIIFSDEKWHFYGKCHFFRKMIKYIVNGKKMAKNGKKMANLWQNKINNCYDKYINNYFYLLIII